LGIINRSIVGKVKEGQQAHFKVEAFLGEIFTGRVIQVCNDAEVDQDVVWLLEKTN
jgi:hypothetical protein